MTTRPLTVRQMRVLTALDELVPEGRDGEGVPSVQIGARLGITAEQARGALRALWGANLVATGRSDYRARLYWPRHDEAALAIRVRRGMADGLRRREAALCKLCHRPIERHVAHDAAIPASTAWTHSGDWRPRHLAVPIGAVSTKATRP